MALHKGPEIDPDVRDAGADDKEIVETLSQFIRSHLPYMEDKPSLVETCIYTVCTAELMYYLSNIALLDGKYSRVD